MSRQLVKIKLILLFTCKSLAITNFTVFPQKLFLETLFLKEIKRADAASAVKFLCYTMDSEELFALRLNDEAAADRLLRRHPLVFLLHGWMDEGTSNWVQEIQTAWRQFQDVNLCAVDWREFAGKDYKSATLKIFRVGSTIAQMVKWLESYRGFARGGILLVGYSLGAHAAGFAGSQLHGQIGEIIGLDPAGPLFTMPYDVGLKYRLDESDAKFVQVIHTSGGTLGSGKKCGHADFYPNGGATPQANCVYPGNTEESRKNPIGCSHSTVVKFFKYSLNPDYPYVGWDCSNYKHFKLGLCQFNKMCKFGIHSERRRGNFYFTTLSTPPYVQLSRSGASKRLPENKKVTNAECLVQNT